MNGDSGAKEVVERWYIALAAGDMDSVIAAFHPEVTASVVGTTPLSGRFSGRDDFVAATIGVLFDALDPEHVRFAQNWSIFSVDGPRVVGLMSGDAVAKNGEPYNSVYCQLFTIGGGQIVEYLEFVDTVRVEAAICDNLLSRPAELRRNPMTIADIASR